MTEEFTPHYDHKAVEEKIYRLWEKSGYFRPENLPATRINADKDADKRRYKNISENQRKHQRKSAFCIIMPPPNANGSLHIGHAVFVTLQDILIRFWRMRGRKTLWLPGADHAGFETQVVFDKKLEKEGRSRFSSEGGSASGGKMSREEAATEMWEFTQKNKKIMENQLRKLGASCDWSREKFTLDSKIVEEVQKTFITMHEDGLIYRDMRIVNWCPKHKTALSDLEVKYIERTDPLYYIKYGPLLIATVRPETKFGDTALAVNPKDKRYQKYIGKVIEAQGILGPLKFKVIKDDAVNPSFGTGVVKVTPAHDATDFEIWTRHKSEIPGPKIVIDENGRLTGEVGEFHGLKVAEAREKVAEEMRRIGILEKTNPHYIHQVATCYKCGSTLEPRPLPQWFIKMKPLAERAIKVVEQKKIKFYPERTKKVYFHWLKNIRDWNISRQIVWGIRIPAWFHEPKCVPRQGHEKEIVKCREFIVSLEKPKCEFCDAEFIQDPDVFDTWFSSAQWPFLTLGYKGEEDKPRREAGWVPTGYGEEWLGHDGIMGFAESVVPQVLIGKRRTYRLRNHNIQVGEKLFFENSEAKKIFGYGIFTHTQKTTVGEIHLPDEKHGGGYKTTEELIKAFKRHYPEKKVTPNTSAWIYDFEFKQDHGTFDSRFLPARDEDYKTFYPTDIMETGYDILFFWVARMIMMSLYRTGKIPFRDVYLHGLVRDKDRQKMSKSKGNVINPLGVAETYGMDAVRMALVVGNTPGNDIVISEEKIRGYRNFATKIWNVSRFVLMNKPLRQAQGKPTPADKKNLAELEKIKSQVTKHIEKFEFHLAAEKMYHYFWHTFADKIIESYKLRLKNKEDSSAAYQTLETILLECLKMLHPFMPFITEEIYQKFEPGKMLMIEKW